MISQKFKIDPEINEIIATGIKKQNKFRFKCFVEGCSRPAIDSHSQSLSNALSKIGEKGHLIRFEPGFFVNEKDDVNCFFKRIGVNQASTFKGFCNKHDSDFFRAVDNLELKSINKETLARLAFRSFAYETRTKEKVLLFEEHFVNKAYHFCDVSYNRYFAEGIRNHLRVTKPYYLKKFIRIINSQNYKPVQGLVFVTNKLIPLSCSAVIDPTMTGAEDLTQQPLQKPLNLVFFNLIPGTNSSLIIFTYFQEQSKNLKRFIRLFKNLETIVFNCCEEILMNPSFYEGLGPELKSKIIDGLTGWSSWDKICFSDLIQVKLKSPMTL